MHVIITGDFLLLAREKMKAEWIAAFLGIKEGDKLKWKIDIHRNEHVAVVKKQSED